MASIIHADNQYRDSFAYDVIEPFRPKVDKLLLDFIQTHVVSRKVFHETRDGGVRLTLKLTPFLADTLPL